MYLGSWKVDDLLCFVVNTHTTAGAASDADSPPSYRVYEDETGTAILTGTMALLDDANTLGQYSEQITLSALNGFEKGKCYNIRITATVGGVAGATIRSFQMEAEVDANVVSGAVPSVTGAVGSVTGAVGSVTGAVGSVTGNVGGNVVGTVASVTGAVGSVTGAVGSVTGNVGGNVTGTVGALAAQAKADVNAEVDTALADIHLDHLLAADYDPAAKPGVATALLNELIGSDAGVSQFTANALELAPGASVTVSYSTVAAALAAAVEAGTITLSATYNSVTLTGLGSLTGRTKLYVTVKSSREQADTAALLQWEENTGLVYLNGAAATASEGALTVNDAATGSITFTLKSASGVQLSPGTYEYDVSMITSASNVAAIKAQGKLLVRRTVTRAIT